MRVKYLFLFVFLHHAGPYIWGEGASFAESPIDLSRLDSKKSIHERRVQLNFLGDTDGAYYLGQKDGKAIVTLETDFMNTVRDAASVSPRIYRVLKVFHVEPKLIASSTPETVDNSTWGTFQQLRYKGKSKNDALHGYLKVSESEDFRTSQYFKIGFLDGYSSLQAVPIIEKRLFKAIQSHYSTPSLLRQTCNYFFSLISR